MSVNSASPCTRSPDKVSDVSGRGKAESTRGTRYIALHPRHCARFSAMRISEMLQSSARRAYDGTRRWRMAVVTMRSRIRYGIAGGSSGGSPRNEHKILGLFRRTPISRFLYLELNVPNIFAILPPPSSVLSLLSPGSRPLHTSWPAPRLSSYFSRYVSESPPPSRFLLLPLGIVLLRSLQTLLHSREIAFKLFGFLTWRGFIVRNPCRNAQDAGRLKRSRSVPSRLECCLISFDYT